MTHLKQDSPFLAKVVLLEPLVPAIVVSLAHEQPDHDDFDYNVDDNTDNDCGDGCGWVELVRPCFGN